MSRVSLGPIRSWYLARWPFAFSLLLLAVLAALLHISSASSSPLVAVADAYVDSGSPTTNFGASTSLRLDSSPTVQRTFIRFSISGISEPVTSAKLRFICTNGSSVGGTVWTISGSWTEASITWDNQPSLVAPVTQLGAITCDSTNGTAVEYDVTSVVTGEGTYDFALDTTSGNGIRFRSRELPGSAPQLIINQTPTSTVDQIHLSWTGDPATTMTIMWRTPASGNPAAVQYGPDTGYGSVESGTSFLSTGAGYLQRVTLTGLTPGSAYHYRVSADDSSWSADHSFRTAPLGDSDFRFLATADMGTPKDGKHLNSVTISNAMAARASGLAFTVGAGDYWYAIGSADEATVDQWFNQNEALMSEAPFMPAFGNHENDTSIRYYTRFSLPPPENYYSYRYGSAHFLVIDTNVSFLPGSAQRSFIESDLQVVAADPSVSWIFVVLHDPPFASRSTFEDLTVRNELSPLFDLWGVDVVITGHAHYYERSFPVRADGTITSTDPSLYTVPGAPIYLVTGGGGADPQSSCPSTGDAWSATCQSVYQFLEFNVTATSVQVSAIGSDGVAFDGFTLNGGTPGDTSPPSQPQNLTATAVSAGQVDLSWQASSDDTGVASYDIYRDASKVATVSGLTTVYSDTTVSPSTTYAYTVMAFDAAGNPSPESAPAFVTTPALPPTEVLTFAPTDDAYVRSDKPGNNYGSRSTLQVDGSPQKKFFLKFTVLGVAGRTVVDAKLRLYNTNASSSGGDFHLVADTSWGEDSITWGTAPTVDATVVSSLGRVSAGNWYEVDVTSLFARDGTVSLGVISTASNGADYYSKEGSAGFAPQLIVTVSADGTGDTSPPSQPQNLTATAVSDNRVDLSWQASIDDIGIAGYDIYRDSSKLATVSGFTTAYSDTAVSPSTTYSYTVIALDAAGNQSPESDPASATTPALPPTETLNFTPTDDAYVRSDKPTRNYGARTTLQVDGSPQKEFLLKFSISGIAGREVVSAKLRLYNVDPSTTGGDFHLVADSWSEATVTWGSAPAVDPAMIASLGQVSAGSWYEVDVTPLIAGDGTMSLLVVTSSSNGADYYSKEGPTGFGPQLVVTVSSDSSGDTTSPSQPQNLMATAVSAGQVDLSWQASSDDTGVADYDVYRNGSVRTQGSEVSLSQSRRGATHQLPALPIDSNQQHRRAPGYHRLSRRSCHHRFNERTGTPYNDL